LKRYFKLFGFKKLNIHHEGHEEHEEKIKELLNYFVSQKSFVSFVVKIDFE